MNFVPNHVSRMKRTAMAVSRVLSSSALMGTGLVSLPAPQVQAAPALGFTINNSDLRFILTQIQIAEGHVAAPGYPCSALRDQIPSPVLPYGLRTVDGRCNNLIEGQEEFGAADRVFPRLAPASFREAEANTEGGALSSYAQKSGRVTDSVPRLVSNLIVDQTLNNPAAVAAAGEGAEPDFSETLFIPNRAPDEGLSAPYNSTFTLFGQFFDHGLDLVTKGGGTVFVPLRPDDPLYIEGSPTNFMVLTRATNLPGPDGILGTSDDVQEATNTTTPFVDQNQTYTSHPSHQIFLRAYLLDGSNRPIPTGKLLDGQIAGNIANWADVKAQAAGLLGIELTDADISNVPLLATDPYGHFVPGPNGFPQVVFPGNVLVEGNPAAPISVAGAVRTGHAFLDDIAHNAVPRSGLTPDSDEIVNGPGPLADGTTYDDELLDSHFVTGDGRGNENIGLTAIHTVFHSEHNRLAVYLNDLINALPAAQKDQWMASNAASGWEYGERLFQAARFVTEMQYQHLVFEEFARKVQPQVNVFASYHTDIDPAISAEFAHTVYRFGHSMLTEVVARNEASGAAFDIPLLDAFLNPLAFNQGRENPAGTTPILDARVAAGSIFRGMTDQVGNELDEFVTEALRNKLLGLPLDLATINLARGRSEGIPRLQAARAAFFNETGNAALAPYQNWADFGLGLRHPESLVNFIAAYGTHPSITGTLDERRAAAAVLLDPASIEAPPEDSLDFITRTGSWANRPTGLGDVDFWVGGLAEAQSPFGGLLGSTFNYVFETQLEKLQDGDRFYYLSRTAGLNLLVQLEGNSFAEIVMRNTDANALPADAFSRADFRFNVDALGASGPITNDPNTTVNEATLLTRMTDGTIRFAGAEHVVWNGTTAANWLRSGLGDDTLRGNEGDDRLEGGAGNDQLIGGEGDDILTDSFGDDVLKGGDGNDALFSGPGFDLNQGGLGNDYIVGGSDPTETFGGPGNDVIFAGDSSDTVFGDDGDDWIEGGGQSDLLQGDNGAPFQDDPNEPGNDVIIGNGGDDDYDAEGGDDIMVTGPGIERNEGMLGFDWVTHKNDPAAANADMQLSALLPPNVDALRDRYDLVEALSGWRFNDNLRGDSRDATTMVGHELTDEGIARIAGLAELLPAGATSFTGGNIILGGAGSDRIEGRGGNDLIDGDAWLNVQLAAAYAPDDVRVFDSMNPLRTDVQTGVLNPGFIEIRREIVPGTAGTDIDTAVFSGPQEDYDMSVSAGVVTVIHARGTGLDGIDTLRHIERLAFCNAIDANGDCPSGQETFLEVGAVGSNTPATGTINISDTSPAENQVLTASPAFTDGQGVNTASIVLTWEAFNGSAWTAVGTGANFTPGDALVSQPLRVVANFTDNAGHAETITSAPTDPVANVNSLPVGIPTLDASGAQPQTQTQITANIDAITDEDGLSGASFSFRWQQSSGGLFTDIPGATGLAFTPGPAEVGKRVRIAVSFIDDRGTLETVFSALSGIVGNVMTGTAAADFLNGTGGKDKISPLAGNDTVNANGGDDLILIGLNSGYDAVNGGPGTDRMEALASNTFIGLSSLTGVEQISGNGFSNVVIRGTSDANILNFANVTLTGIARINGGAGDDTLTGSNQADVIDGGSGADNLIGGGGDDLLLGGAGPDTMNGGGGLDTFRFASGFGADVINGFDANPAGGQDLLDIRQLGVSAGTFASRVVIAGVGADTVVTISSGGTIRLVARSAATISASDFIVNP